MAGTGFTPNFTGFYLAFNPCYQEIHANCASKEEIETFLASNYLYVNGYNNHIDMIKVLPKEETLQSGLHNILNTKINLDQPQFKLV